jgi:hypothetical protein
MPEKLKSWALSQLAAETGRPAIRPEAEDLKAF